MTLTAIATVLSYFVCAAFGAGLFFFIVYLAHRFAHLSRFRTTYQAHVVGHHGKYHGTHLETPEFEPVPNRAVVDTAFATVSVFIILVPVLVWHFLWPYFVILIADGAVIGALSTWIHETFHVKGHWLCRYQWYLRGKALHALHHRKPKHNFGFLIHWFDRIFGTFRDVPPTTG